ncbi:1-acyl-sn-glycerol-3-phosphate acyltransferase [Rhodococcus triatomae]|uniref:1-acyl-sn-glycerol-3-phosphate acyltransferases n=1 Tax=Rhodococcus triatomae TaxID=300028 RepID=A0A1G8HXG3_9NOCA|nr:lysophospholipid acyltransferase family protein [Rhodococcus triatomae]QNG20905.1 1-acyl-sn-glycerol-3-phosphate acyltransferase [Rhodococcus triatomae]QNG23180.1 1-acyl-sn-glycerol-3-phosphate acyltransferase [Rhodococcus triatomae]SDI11356.1 1-acyl-sn-glycerol-3-phosphate acyltransferases [Rhodococcus triatomae]
MAVEPVYTFTEYLARGISAAQGLRVTRTGLDRIPRSGGAVVAVNHTAYLDFVPLGVAVGDSGRRLRIMAKAELARNPVLRFLMRGCGVIPVDRTEGADSYARAVDALRAGELVGVYPEATISRSFEIKGFKSGAARMALEAQVPVIPVIVWGAHRVATKGQPRSLGRHRFPVRVAVGEPLPPRGSPDALTATLRERMQQMLADVQEDFDHPAGAWWVPRRLGGSAPTLEEATALDEAEARERREKRERRDNREG